jgi:serpin B
MITSHGDLMVRKRLSVLLLLAFFWFSNCPGWAADASASPNSTAFALKFGKECAGSSTGNTVISPYGAYSLLSLLVNGAVGSTQAEMFKMLGTDAARLGELNAANKAACKSLSANDKDLKLSVANAIFVDKGFSLLPEFTKVATDTYFASTELVDFDSPETLTAINAWVKDKTHGCIPQILDKLMKGDSVVLLNAVYFKGRWLTTFSKESTESEPFHLAGGTDKKVSMMHRTGQISYWSGPDLSAVELPYFANKQSLFVVLPGKNKSATDLLQTLDEKTWRQMSSQMKSVRVDLSLPKFHVEFKKELNPVLKKMGMTMAFNPRLADFGALSHERVFVSRAVQKTFMDVDELGTEAAAATAITMMTMAMPVQSKSIEFRVDRPFLVGLQDQQTGQLLFLGAINEP